MSYRDRIFELSELTMESLIQNCKENVPETHKRHPYYHPELKHGVNLLESDDALDCYMAAYGEMHHTKCRAALQNMPYPLEEASDQTKAVEIIDWGCGQGIGSICIIDFLKERELTQWLKRVTLIEPSQKALERAVINVEKATNKGVRIVPINSFLPTEGEDNEITGINCEQRHVIHIFSNILDVIQIDLEKVAKCIAIGGKTHYILCVGPVNGNAYRIDNFCKIFQPKSYFSNINNRNYGRTSDSNYLFTCKTKGFVYEGTHLDFTKLENKPFENVLNEYDINLHIKNGLLSLNKAWVYYYLQSVLLSNDLIYIDPDINGINPDFIIIRPNVGIIVISVFEEILSNIEIIHEGKTKILKLFDETNGTTKEIESPYTALENYQNQIIENIKEFTEAVIDSNRNLGLVKKVLICTGGERNDVINILGESSYTTVYGKEFISSQSCSQRFFDDLRFFYPNPIFNDVVLSKLKQDLSPRWHSYKEGNVVKLSTAQKNLVKSAPKSQHKISGVAGSGKTQVLATRAVNAQLRTGGEILVLTFNITLANYMKMRISQVRADFPWDKIHLDYYHRFFRKNAHKNNLHVNFSSYEDINFFSDTKSVLPKFDAILIDEVQDYLTPWLQILRRYFLKEDGEFIVFGDPKQNIYHRALDDEGNVRIGIIPGLWNKTLTTGHRFSNPSLAHLAGKFQNLFDENLNDGIAAEPDVNYGNGFQFNILKYAYLNSSNSTNIYADVYQEIVNFINAESSIKLKDIVIIGSQTEILKYIDFNFRNSTGNKTTVTFLSHEDEKKISRQSEQASFAYQRDYRRLENVVKTRFTMLTNHLKLSTIQSFKGWEAPTVICIIQNDKYSDENVILSNELVYTGITRAKENLFVINIGNEKYHEFFQNNMN